VVRVLLAVILIILLAVAAGAVTVKWTSLTNPSDEQEQPSGICIGGDYVYVVGFDRYPGDWQWRIEKRSKADGRPVKIWTKNPTKYSDSLLDCVVVGGKLYVVGSAGGLWTVLSLDLNLNIVKEVSVGFGVPLSVASDGKYLYIAGESYAGGNDNRWRVEKRRLDDLSLVAVYTSNPEGDLALDIGINPATSHLWIIGSEGTAEDPRWRIEVLDRDLVLLLVLKPGIWGGAQGVVFDENGNAYVYGDGGVVKYSRDGKELARAATNGYFAGAVYVDSKLYVMTDDHRLIVFDVNLRRLGEVDLRQEVAKRVNVEMFDMLRVAFDGETIYVAGVAMLKGAFDEGWLVSAIQITTPTYQTVTPPTQTVTITQTTQILSGFDSLLVALAAVVVVVASVFLAVKRRRK